MNITLYLQYVKPVRDLRKSLRAVSTMTEDEERARKRAKVEEYKEFDQVLQFLDHQDHHDLAAHLLLATRFAKRKQFSRSPSRQPEHGVSQVVIPDTWTAWPLPADVVPRTSAGSYSIENQENFTTPLHAEIEATILRLAGSQFQAEKKNEANGMSADEHPPFEITEEVTKVVLPKLDRLLHALARVKYQQATTAHGSSKVTFTRESKSRWDEVVGLAGIAKCVDSEATMKRIMERCNTLFGEDMDLEIEGEE